MKVSVVVPVYNVEKYIKQCIYSICNQTYKNLEIIVINDGSSDNSVQIIKEIDDNRIKIIEQENKGLSVARNVGVEYSTGNYILFVDSDDYLENKEAIEEMCIIAQKDNSDIVVGNAIKFYEDNSIQEIYRERNFFYRRRITSAKYLIDSIKSNSFRVEVCLNLYSASLIKNNNIFFKPGIKHEDELFTPQVFALSNTISIYPKNFYMYRQRVGSIMHSNKDINRGNDLILICSELLEKMNEISNNKNVIKLFENRIFNLLIDTLIVYDIIKIPINLKILMLKKSVNFNQFILHLIMFLNFKFYMNILKKKVE